MPPTLRHLPSGHKIQRALIVELERIDATSKSPIASSLNPARNLPAYRRRHRRPANRCRFHLMMSSPPSPVRSPSFEAAALDRQPSSRQCLRRISRGQAHINKGLDGGIGGQGAWGARRHRPASGRTKDRSTISASEFWGERRKTASWTAFVVAHSAVVGHQCLGSAQHSGASRHVRLACTIGRRTSGTRSEPACQVAFSDGCCRGFHPRGSRCKSRLSPRADRRRQQTELWESRSPR